jgi:superoxide dismutase
VCTAAKKKKKKKKLFSPSIPIRGRFRWLSAGQAGLVSSQHVHPPHSHLALALPSHPGDLLAAINAEFGSFEAFKVETLASRPHTLALERFLDCWLLSAHTLHFSHCRPLSPLCRQSLRRRR